ncbi:MAG: PilW family protein [Kangiellaceae bacterium]|nr:PilW family protein [Kangiellaceae bacterium]
MIKRQQGGFTLVEYIIAGFLGLLVVAGILSLFLATRTSSATQSSLNEVQDNGRLALMILRNDIQKAGWLDTGVNETSIGYQDNHIIFDTDTFEGEAGAPASFAALKSDSIKVRYSGSADCIGGAVTSGIIENTYYVDDSTKQLMCKGNSSATPQPLVGNVQTLQILYGLDPEQDGSPNQFVDADSVPADTNYAISAIKLTLLVASDEEIPTSGRDKSFVLLNEGTFTATDSKRIIRQYSSTIALPNMPIY